MKVSVCMITYNHEKFISKAIEGVLMQQTSFDYELVIGEDCSNDNTRSILIEFQKKYPNKIKLLLPEKNLGMMPNFITTLQVCKGQYVALCEGDDYWIDPNKLQQQVEFLDANPEFVASFHKVKDYYQNFDKVLNSQRIYSAKVEFDIQDIISSFFINTCSLVFRNVNFKFPEFFYDVYAGDQFLCLFLALNGKFYFHNKEMAVYRIHDTSITRALVSKDNVLEIEKASKAFNEFDKFSNYKFSLSIQERIEKEYLILSIKNCKNIVQKIFLVSFFVIKHSTLNIREIKNIINRYFPALYKYYPFKN